MIAVPVVTPIQVIDGPVSAKTEEDVLAMIERIMTNELVPAIVMIMDAPVIMPVQRAPRRDVSAPVEVLPIRNLSVQMLPSIMPPAKMDPVAPMLAHGVSTAILPAGSDAHLRPPSGAANSAPLARTSIG